MGVGGATSAFKRSKLYFKSHTSEKAATKGQALIYLSAPKSPQHGTGGQPYAQRSMHLCCKPHVSCSRVRLLFLKLFIIKQYTFIYNTEERKKNHKLTLADI